MRYLAKHSTGSPHLVLAAAFPAFGDVPGPDPEGCSRVMLGCSQRQVLSGSKPQPFGRMLVSRQSRQMDRLHQKPKVRLRPCITAQNLAG